MSTAEFQNVRNIVIAITAVTLIMLGAPLHMWSQETGQDGVDAEQLRSEIKRLQGQIQALRWSADAPESWKQYLAIEKKLSEDYSGLRRRMFELSQRSDYAAWERRIEPLSRLLDSLDRELSRQTIDAGMTLTQAHHAELKKCALDDTPQLRAIGFDVLSYPRMDGSTSTQPLATLIACRSFGIPYDWVGRRQAWPGVFRLSPAAREAEAHLLEFTARAIAENPSDERLAAIINGLLAANASTHGAYVNLIEGKSNIALLARPPSAAELQLARSKGVELDWARCALDALVFLVNSENPVKKLSTAQIRNIYLNRVTDWRSVGGSTGNIIAYHREENSGSEELMRTLVMTDTSFRTPPHRDRQIAEGSMIGLFLALTSEKQGLGYSVYYYERFMSGSPRTKVIAVDGVEPTYETIRDRTYPYTCEVLVVIRKELDEHAPARRLRDWLRSAEGQAVVLESGYVPNTSRER
jgi:phosphate transport system substrate-binding protein